ncbi:ADP-heptose--LPS heptosyltransferase [Granulibacter bethesdensis]|uniref:ADP-heptose--LPS heptosyltransferase n=2 Tax=Granulibacter bethesdensis TaxID=364410 RepID=A0AAN0RC03_9PROT|nr:ADP-heptose--LPS heptosyltransferase [Granulibacter bethesdensis]
MMERILVIKHGAFGDLVQALDAFHAIRLHHPAAWITLLTAPAYRGLTSLIPWFDDVVFDPRPAWWRLDALLLRRQWFRRMRFQRVYDLQCSSRTARYFALIPHRERPEWIGAARGASHPNPDFSTGTFSNRDKMAAQLRTAGLPPPSPAPMDWLDANIDALALPPRFALLIPGCSPHLPWKRWPAPGYAALAKALEQQGLSSVAVGTEADRDAIRAIRQQFPALIDLAGRTSLPALAAVARRSALTVGNDTGATFLASALGTPTLMLMSAHTDPVISAPWGQDACWIKRDDLSTLPPEDVLTALPAIRPG